MSSANDYRMNAEDCLRMATKASEERDRPLWATMAQSWLRLAEHADRVKTRLLANVSHELRAPLNVILGYSQAALAVPNSYGLDVPAALRRDLEHIYASGNHLIRLINDLLDLSRAEVDTLDLFPELIAPGAFLEEVFQRASSHAASRPDVTWRLAVAPRLPLLQADPVRLRQVLKPDQLHVHVVGVALAAQIEHSYDLAAEMYR